MVDADRRMKAVTSMVHDRLPHAWRWTAAEKKELDRLDSPRSIQDFLDELPYNPEPVCRSPREVLRERRAHCMEGALFAAAAISRLEQPPLVVDLRAANEYMIRRKVLTLLGAKSNTTLLRMRDPVYRTVRELALSYFPFYFNVDGEMSLRSYSTPLDLSRFDRLGWRFSAADQEYIGNALDRCRHTKLLEERVARRLHRASRYLIEACFAGADPKGLFRPSKTG